MQYTVEIKRAVADQVRKVLGDSGLAKLIIESAESGRGFELRYSRMPLGVVASTSGHYRRALGKVPEYPKYYGFVDDALHTAMSIVDDGSVKYRIEFMPKRFRMDAAAVELFARAWDLFYKEYCSI